ncbi:unnamed protein product [Amoebophrya sp. A120]|nr:unnamed protein product [Amoebophrya sp. A120]|eukprot:GSA120T00001072001.1
MTAPPSRGSSPEVGHRGCTTTETAATGVEPNPASAASPSPTLRPPHLQAGVEDPNLLKQERRDSVPAVPTELARVRSLVARFSHTPDAEKLVFVMVGLPARGKSFIALRLQRFLNWLNIETKVFNVGNFRRETETGVQDSSYFDSANTSRKNRREELAMLVLDHVADWLSSATTSQDHVRRRTRSKPRSSTCVLTPTGAPGGSTTPNTGSSSPQRATTSGAVQQPHEIPEELQYQRLKCAIFDATNTTRDRRKRVAQKLYDRLGAHVGVVFLESTCNEPEVLNANLNIKLEKSPDYAGLDRGKAREDLVQRILHYEQVYEPLEEEVICVENRNRKGRDTTTTGTRTRNSGS